MKTKILFVVVSFFLAVGLTNAQTKSFSYYSQETLDAIEASVEQQEKIRTIRKNTNDQIRATKRDSNLTEEEKKEKFKEIYREGGKLYNEVLTSEQIEKLKRLHKEFREKQA